MGLEDMLLSVREYLSLFGLVDERILGAMRNVDRLDFVNNKEKNMAYVNAALPIGEGQTISQPSTVARMISLLQLKDSDNVLEIGTGSGWNAALMAFIAENGKVTSLEISDALANRALKKLNELDIKNVIVGKEDFRLLIDKFDKIIFTAGISLEDEKEIEDFIEMHLNEGGISVCPFQSGPLILMTKKNGKITKRYTDDAYMFVPLILN